MAYSVTGLTDYIKDYEDELIKKSMFDGRTVSLIKSKGKVFTGIKSSENITILDNPIGFQADSCGFNASGTTTFTKVNLTVGKIKINQTFCEKDLETKWTQNKLSAGSKYDTLTFSQDIGELYAGELGQALEQAIWQGDTTSGSNVLAQFDGLAKLIAAGVAVDGNPTAITTATGITAGNVVGIFNGIYSAIPAIVLGKEDVMIFCGYDVYRTYQLALVTANLFNYAQSVGGLEQITIPGSNVNVTPVHGLDGLSKIYAFRMSNIYLGVDLENEEERFEVYYDKSSDLMRFDARFKMGVQVGIIGETVEFLLV